MKIRYFKLFLTLSIIALVVAFFVWKSITPKNVLTEAEAAETLICYLQSLDDHETDLWEYNEEYYEIINPSR